MTLTARERATEGAWQCRGQEDMAEGRSHKACDISEQVSRDWWRETLRSKGLQAEDGK